MHQQFPANELFQAGAVLDPDSWPTDEVAKAFHGDMEIV
jgi:hypothetical protein